MSSTGPRVTERFFGSLSAFFIIFLLIIGLGPESNYSSFTVEDGFLENATAILCFLGAYFCLRDLQKRIKFLRKFSFPVFLAGFLFFFVAGEEIAWGQRMMAFRPLLVGAEVNYQRDWTFHNTMYVDVVVYLGGALFLALFTVIIPFVTYFLPKAKAFCMRCGLPLMHPFITASVLLGIVVFVLIPQVRFLGLTNLDVGYGTLYALRELREFYFAFLFFCYVLTDYFSLLKKGEPFDFKTKGV